MLLGTKLPRPSPAGDGHTDRAGLLTVLIGHDHAAVVGVDGADAARLADDDVTELAAFQRLLLEVGRTSYRNVKK